MEVQSEFDETIGGLTSTQSQVLACLAAGMSVKTAAGEVGIQPATIFHWRQYHPRFIQAEEELRAAAFCDALALARYGLTTVVKQLLHLAQEHESGAVRIRASELVLKMGMPELFL